MSVLILGGVGFIGRHFVHYLVANNLSNDIRVVDKVLPETALLSKKHRDAFTRVEFRQANLTRPDSIKASFDRDDGTEFDYVFNFAAETKYSQVPEVYEERIYRVAVNCGYEAARRGIKVFVVMSTAEIYDSGPTASTETSRINPWTIPAKYKFKAKQELKTIQGLNLVILRPAIVYGTGTTMGLTPRLIIGRIYKQLDEKMKLLWSKDLKLNTVHVLDVARACWHVARWYIENAPHAELPIFNLSDKQNTDQETINGFLTQIFGIRTGYHSSFISAFTKLHLDSVIKDINRKHLPPWAELLQASNIQGSPLSPYLDKELLYNHDLSIDGSKIERVTGFNYVVPYLTQENLEEIIQDFQALDVWPRN
ncbi:uncharacterized protein BYT42DRAFT_550737 [Radiomyces spectabilis]|uniref:uncharacterized protein n=1 Tax=Radiomyces spectabilis TaxID=64574 RepID=UPI00221EECDD|nr:uncharacterized protein BYT42DRAFT_550737 [Radiomyces spectabilis]KAI8393355.1 hypothetical protein BYT42DRAFT_550737 [Radiomyces spectabilis]